MPKPAKPPFSVKRVSRALRHRAGRWLSRLRTGAGGQARGADGPLAGKFCPNPFRQVDLEESGVCYTCCSSWLPTPMGNVQHAPLDELWNGTVMQKIRASIHDGSYRYCRHDRCPAIQGDSLMDIEDARADPVFGPIVQQQQTVMEQLPAVVNMVNDRSCNLYCPSCRTERINHNEGEVYQRTADIQERFLEAWLGAPNQRDFTLSITGSGDPFASRAYRELLYTLNGRDFPNMKIALQTNGVLLTPRNWARMEGVHGNIASIIISMDAASAETYALTRRGGHWDTLMANCRRMGELRRSGEVRQLRYDFVVQKANFREMPAFVHLARELGGDAAYFSRLVDWSTWPRREFLEQCVWLPGHPLREEFLAVMADPALHDDFVDLGNLSEYRREAIPVGLGLRASSTI